MSGFDRARDRLVDQLPCACRLRRAASREGQISGRAGAGIHAEAELGFAVSLGVVNFAAPVRNAPAPREIALERRSILNSDARPPPPSAAPRVPLRAGSFRPSPGPTQARRATNCDPPTVIGVEPLLGIVDPRRKLSDAREGGFRFLGGEALGPHHGLAVAGLQFQPSLARRGGVLNLSVVGERLEQRLRLGDLGKLRRRRKAFQRRPENVVGVDRAAGGLVELGQRQRGAQLEAAGLLLLRDGDGGEEGGFGGAGFGGVLFEEDFAANAMRVGVEPMLSGLARQRQRFVDPGQGGFRAFPLRLRFPRAALDRTAECLLPCSR